MAKNRKVSLLIARHAVENAGNEPITDRGIVEILGGGSGSSSHLRAVFGDVSLQALMAAAAANPELDRAQADDW
jgi:hypothetical protein